MPGVIGAAPAVIGKAMITGLTTDFVDIKGIDVMMEPGVTDIGHAMTEGSLSNLTPATDDDLAGHRDRQGSRRLESGRRSVTRSAS